MVANGGVSCPVVFHSRPGQQGIFPATTPRRPRSDAGSGITRVLTTTKILAKVLSQISALRMVEIQFHQDIDLHISYCLVRIVLYYQLDLFQKSTMLLLCYHPLLGLTSSSSLHYRHFL